MWTRLKKWKPPLLSVIIVVLLASKITGNTNDEPDLQITYETHPFSIEFFVSNENYNITGVTCKSVTGTYNGNATNVCEDLDPCTTYLADFVIVAIDGDDQNIPYETISVNTTYAEPEVELVEVIPYQFNMMIKWTATNRTCISKFDLNLKSIDKDKDVSNVLTNVVEFINITDLYPCQIYDIKLKTINVMSEVVSEIEDKSETGYAEPEDVIGIKFEAVENDVVKVSWDPPVYKHCIKYYYLKWATVDCIEEMKDQRRQIATDKKESIDVNEEGVNNGESVNDEDGECKWRSRNITDSNTKEYLLSNLDGCEDYGLLFYINDDTIPKSEVSVFISPEQIPSEVSKVIYKINSTAIGLDWNTPTSNRKCIQMYTIDLVGPTQLNPEFQETYNIETEDNFTEFRDLDPCGEYKLTIKALSRNGTGGPDVILTIKTDEDSPTKIRNVTVVPKPKSLALQWAPPAFADLCLEGYRITGWYDSSNTSVFDKSTNDTNITVDGLISCQVYTVQIIPFTKSKDGELEQIEQETSPKTAAAPDPFQDLRKHSHSLELSARVQNDDFSSNNCQTLFARFVCEAEGDVPYKRAIQYVEGILGDVSFVAFMSPLSPYTKYECVADFYNTAGWSDATPGIFYTEKYYPEEPLNVSVKSLTTNSIRFQWSVPRYSNGDINIYKLYFRRVQAAYFIPSYCDSQPTEALNTETSKLDVEFASLNPYTYYSVQIAAQNEYGTGDFTLPTIERTLPSVSDVATNPKVILINGPDVSSATFKAYVVFSWHMPCKSHGEIESFELEFLGTRAGYETVNFIRKVEPKYDEGGLMTFNETDLQPEYSYEVSICIINKNVLNKSERSVLKFDAPAGIPEKFPDTNLAKVDAFAAKNPTTSAVVRFPVSLLSSDSGTIMYAALLLLQKDCNLDPELLVGAIDSQNEWPDSAGWIDAYIADGCIHQYQTTPIRWRPDQPRSDSDDGSERYIEYTIGTDTCTNASKKYCNGPLKADTEYQMIIRLFTKSSYSDAAVLDFKTDSLIQLTLILIAIISCLMVAFLAGFLYLYITKKIIWHRESCHGIEDSSGDITSKNFAIFYTELSKRDKVQREFKELTVIATDFTFSASEANEYKNRYRDIFPYDKNRVILDIDADGNDYINASFINGYQRKKEYIATQGPKQESVVDFWRMVLQHNVRIIVMVTQFKEEDVIKCHHYYPWEWKDIKVEISKEDYFELYDRREMIVTHSKQNIRRKIVHFYFKKWPDHGVPTDPMNLITFVRKVKSEKIPSDSPIVVHCSAGVGRTGTFIALDIIMQRLKNESKMNIFETVKELRFQRMKMVQSLQQYTFLYTCSFQLVLHKCGKYINQKKVSFQNDQDRALEAVQKVGVANAESGECNI